MLKPWYSIIAYVVMMRFTVPVDSGMVLLGHKKKGNVAISAPHFSLKYSQDPVPLTLPGPGNAFAPAVVAAPHCDRTELPC